MILNLLEGGLLVPTETMTAKERWLAVLQRKKPDRLPTDYWATSEVTEMLLRHTKTSTDRELFTSLHIDVPISVSPAYRGPELATDEDVFGCRYRNVNYGTGSYRECVTHPLARYASVAEIEDDYQWPDPDWWDYKELSQQIQGMEEYPVRGGGSEPFLKYKDLRGQEQAFMDLVLNPDMVHYCLDKLFDLAYTDTLRIYEQLPGQVNITYVAEDMGSETDLMLSPEHVRTFLLPRMQRIVDLAHEAGAYVFHHNDGAIRRIIPDLIDLGIDVLNPIQWRCPGMERQGLKADFGSQLVFHGGVDNQQTLAFGTPADVEAEVLENIRILGEGGGYIIAPCHNIQPVSAPETIVALYKTAWEHGWR